MDALIDGSIQLPLQNNNNTGRRVRRRINQVGDSAPAADTQHSRVQLRGFLDSTESKIRDAQRANALIGVVQLASADPGGIINSLGYGNRTVWVRANIEILFQAGGPLDGFIQVAPGCLQGHLSAAIKVAKSHYTMSHSNEPTGAGHEDIPEWATHFFPLFEQQNQTSRNARTAAARDEHRQVVRSLTGAQAPHIYDGSGPAQLRVETAGETAGNAVPPNMRRQVIGQVSEERTLVEGRDDIMNVRPARTDNPRNGVRRRNVAATGFGADDNDPSERFRGVVNGFGSLDALTQAITHAFVAPPPAAPRQLINMLRDYNEASQMMQLAQPERRAVYESVMNRFNAEVDQHLSQANNRATSGDESAAAGAGVDGQGDNESNSYSR